jgi:hypothetical protein
MISPLSNTIFDLNMQASLSLEDALNALMTYTLRYKVFLERIIAIKTQAPPTPDEQSFRGHRQSSSQLYTDIYALIEKFHDYLQKFEMNLSKTRFDYALFSQLTEKLLSSLDKFVTALQALYQGKSTSFASLLNDIVVLQQIIHQKIRKFDLSTEEKISQIVQDPLHYVMKRKSAESFLSDKEKYVYVRIFHRLMPSLGADEQTTTDWIAPLLASVRYPEKHGFAVYADESLVKTTLKDAHYGYITLKITEDQDITSQRPERVCPIVGCPLLTITNIELSNMLSLTHGYEVYEIQEGALYRKHTP